MQIDDPERIAVPFKRTCPKCRSASFSVTEVLEAHVTRAVVDGEIIMSESSLDYDTVMGVEGSCPCGHHWRFRANSIMDLMKY